MKALIGLCLRIKLKWSSSFKTKLEIHFLKKPTQEKTSIDKRLRISGSCNADPQLTEHQGTSRYVDLINSYFIRTKLIVTLYLFKFFVKYKGLMLNNIDLHLTAIFKRIIAKQ